MSCLDTKVTVTIERLHDGGDWGWEVETPKLTMYGYEPDYMNAEDMARQALKEMGVEP